MATCMLDLPLLVKLRILWAIRLAVARRSRHCLVIDVMPWFDCGHCSRLPTRPRCASNGRPNRIDQDRGAVGYAEFGDRR